MRVALVCPYSLSVVGGVQTQVRGLASTLRAEGCEVTVVAPSDDPGAAEPATVIVGRSIGIRANGSVAPISPLPGAWRRTLREIRTADVVHVHEPFVPGPSLATLLQSKVPVVGTFHQSGFAWPYRLAAPLVRMLGRRISAPVAVSEAAAEMVRGPLSRVPEILWNGVEIPDAVEGHPTTGSTIAFVGRHEERKGLGVLLEAMASLGPDVRLWVMGTGPLTDELRSRHKDDSRIEWLGRVSDAERDRRLAGADIYCAPNLGGESFGLVLAEAMAAGAAVVASDIAAFRAVARPEHGEGKLFPAGNPQELASVIRTLLADHAARESLRAAGRRRAEELSMRRLARRYREIYERVAD